ncbi:MAG: 4Fe-4S dicluster domain-containing protein, partial [Pseudomonadota bacterium]|nr:4Fe-4S dicluster domain-containing protein [Pseudomonadota bacterium]
KLYRQGVRAIIIATGECSQCARRRQENNLHNTLTALNQALTQRQAPLMIVRQVSAHNWQHQCEHTQEPTNTEQVSRRHFLRRGVQQVVREGLRLQSLLAQDQEQFEPPGLLFPPSDIPSELPYVPQIDAERCSGCDTCLKVCPHQALQFDGDNNQYDIVAERCSGCGLCVDLCEFQAITLNHWQIPQITRLPLEQSRCRYCGVDFHRPKEQSNEHCHVCSRVNHYQNLFQVVE